MTRLRMHGSQRGVITIFIAMIMLLLITLLITAAFSISTTNLRAVGNVQARNEAISAAETAIEQLLVLDTSSSAFAVDRLGISISMDNPDNDLGNTYLVDIPAPICVRADQVNVNSVSSVTLPGFSAGDAWNVVWEIAATATQASTGVSVTVVQGIRVLLTTLEKNAVCT